MFRAILIVSLLLHPGISSAKNIVKVAIVDTGLDLSDPRFADKLCPIGHEDMTGEGMQDMLGHGTHVAGIIQNNAGDGAYCFLVYKYFNDHVEGYENLRRALKAFKTAILNGATIINFSAGGPQFNEEEYLMVKNHPKVTFVVAAGNEGQDLDKKGEPWYPASYRLPNVIAVGNLTQNGKKAYNSNYGSFIKWEIGTNVISTIPCVRSMCTGVMSGTSMATAVRTGKILKVLSGYKKVDK